MNNTQDFQWVPLPTWPGRYRCAKTGILGYRPAEMKMMTVAGDPKIIVPYTCSRLKCDQLATFRVKSKCLCSQHAPKGILP